MMSSETWGKVCKELSDCEARELRAHPRDQVPRLRSVLPQVMATLGEERDGELRPRL